MQYLGLAVVVGLLALIIVLLGLRLLLGGNWLLGWLRGSLGLVFLGLAALVGLLAFEASQHRAIPADKRLATVHFSAQSGQRYEVRVEGAESQGDALLEGDLWQLETQLLHWSGLGELIGLEPGYRLQRLNSRYLAVEQQAGARFAEIRLVDQPVGAQPGEWLERLRLDIPFLTVERLRTSHLPVADGASFAIELAPTGLLATPVNAAAREALQQWQAD